MTRSRSNGQRGQVLVLVALGIVAMLTVLGLIIDGGYVYAQQRGAQNGSDAASTAGALVIAQNLPYRALGQAGPKDDGDVADAVLASATSNGIPAYKAYYTDLNGQVLGDEVGDGTLPAGAWGVKVDADRSFDTFFISVVGINDLKASTTATAIAGYVENAGAGNVLPIIFPLNIIYCLNNGNFETQQPESLWPLNKPVTLPLCKGDAAGNVGWLDWSPPAGGTSELKDAILYPSNPAIPVPSWQFVASTGNVNGQVEDALNTYAGKTVLIPFFDNVCDVKGVDANAVCPGDDTPGGTKIWYHIPLFFGFKMQDGKAAYIQGSNPECGSLWAGAGCLKGEIVSFIGPNVTVGAGTGTSLDAYSAVGVQLIK